MSICFFETLVRDAGRELFLGTSTMFDRFKIVDSNSPRPAAERILFCDGTGGRLYRTETDLELSHWRPNLTPEEFRAGTSTEICLRFLENPRVGNWTIAVNNHVDVDGILSVYVLIEGEHALAHRQTMIEAAEMGDFWSWGELPAQRVFQGITQLMRRGGEPNSIYGEAFRRIPGLIDGTDPQTRELEQSLAPLSHGVDLIEQEEILRTQRGDRFSQYIVPLAIAGEDDARACYAPGFNEAISPHTILWPQVRARWDRERICLVSVERETGWFHDLCFPGYLWADTEGLWRPSSLTYHDGMSSYTIENDQLIAAIEDVQKEETAAGQWGLGGTSLPCGESLQDLFPVVGRFVDAECRPVVSHLTPDQVVSRLAEVDWH